MRSRRLVEHYKPSLPYPMPKQPSFSERTKAMQVVADNLVAMANMLKQYAQEVAAEADRMAAAQERFAERRNGTRERRAR